MNDTEIAQKLREIGLRMKKREEEVEQEELLRRIKEMSESAERVAKSAERFTRAVSGSWADVVELNRILKSFQEEK